MIATAPRVAAKITVADLGKRFGAVEALRGVSFVADEGEFLALIGPSGCGKTTLLHILAGLERPTSGEARVRTESAPAMVFQGRSLFPWYTVRRNIEYGLLMRGAAPERRRATSDRLLAMIGLERFADAYPSQLSEGMRQRVGIARALATDPEVLLMDEPFANLDEQNRLLMQEDLLRIWAQGAAKTVLFVTHSLEEAVLLADRVLVMTAQPGTIKASLRVPFGRPRDFQRVRRDPAFGEITVRLWDLLRDEVVR